MFSKYERERRILLECVRRKKKQRIPSQRGCGKGEAARLGRYHGRALAHLLVLLTARLPLGVLCVSSWWKRKKRRVEACDRAVPTPRGKGERRGLCAGMFLHVSAQSSRIHTTNEEARGGRWMCAINRSITRWSSLVAHPHMRSEYQTTAWRKAALDGPQHPQAPRCASPSSPDNSSASRRCSNRCPHLSFPLVTLPTLVGKVTLAPATT